MSVSKEIISNLSINKFTIESESTQTIHFSGDAPNYYRVTNGGESPLYLGADMMPTEDYFNMKIPASTSKLYVDAHGRKEIYIYNPSLKPINIIITSFKAPFDPSVLAMTDFGQDFADITLSGEFDATGDLKTILNTLRTNSNGMSSNVNEGKEKLVNMDKTLNDLFYIMDETVLTRLSNLEEALATINTNVDTIKSMKSTLSTIYSELIDFSNHIGRCCEVVREYNEATTKQVTINNIWYLSYLTNDSEEDLIISFKGYQTATTYNLTIKPNETISNVNFKGATMVFPIGSKFRMLYSNQTV